MMSNDSVGRFHAYRWQSGWGLLGLGIRHSWRRLPFFFFLSFRVALRTDESKSPFYCFSFGYFFS